MVRAFRPECSVLLAPARDLTLGLSGPPRGDEEKEREQEGGASDQRFKNIGPRVRGAAGTPRKRLEGAIGARFRLRSLAGAGTREVKRLADFCTLSRFGILSSKRCLQTVNALVFGKGKGIGHASHIIRHAHCAHIVRTYIFAITGVGWRECINLLRQRPFRIVE